MVRWLGAFAICAGCGRVGFDARPPTADGNDTIGFGPFQTPVMVTELASTGGNISPCIAFDSLELLWGSTRTTGSYQLWSATRATPTDAWSAVQQLTVPGSSTSAESTFSADATELVFRMPSQVIGKTTRTSRAGSWSTAAPVPELAGYIGPELAGDLRLFISDDLMPRTLFETTRTSATASWTTPRQLTELSGTADRHFATASADGLELIFQDETMPNGRILRATRPAVDQPFGPVETLSFGAPFDQGNVGDPELSADGRTLWFVFGPAGATQIYVVTRDPL